jgi:thiazole tautomerase (transcriptional regulator TenI)
VNRAIPRLHLIGPLVVDPADYPRIAAAAARGGCVAIHVRFPRGVTAETLAMVRAVQSAVQTTVIVNDRLDVALVTGAGGVQLGEQSFTVAEARRLLPDDVLIGRSVHDLDGARDAAAAGASYLLAGHIFDTDSKAGAPGRGLEWLAALVAAVEIPVIALGGITVERIPEVMAAGAYGVALGRELLLADDPELAARAASEALQTIHTENIRGTD